jgi:DNA transposase THAP9
MSDSVADSLDYLEPRKCDFQGCAATAKFIRMINRAFDILNVRSPSGGNIIRQPYGIPVNEKNASFLQEGAEEIEIYLRSLVDSKGSSVLTYPRKCAFIGLISCLRIIFPLFKMLQPYGLHYLLTYKLLQDHIENFFSAVRSCGGYNNNPSAYQFEHAVRK